MRNENHTGRNIAAGLFVAGGILTVFLVEAAKGFGRAQAGMSAGSVHGALGRDALIEPLLCSFFLLSAFGIGSTNDKRALKKYASAACLLLLFAYAIGCSEAHPGKELSGILTLAVIMALYFSPWIIGWLVVLAKADLPPEIKKK